MRNVRSKVKTGTLFAGLGALTAVSAAFGGVHGAVAAPPSPAAEQYGGYMPYPMNPYGNGIMYPMGAANAYPTGSYGVTMPAITVTAPQAVSQQGSSAIRIANFAFNPPTTTVTAGQTVTWTNADSVAHTTTSDTGVWSSGPIQPGASFSQMFPTTGTFTYHCTIHPHMTGSVTVLASATSTSIAPSVTSPVAAAPSGMSIKYADGWNLVAGPAGTVLTGATGSLYTLKTGDTSYETMTAGTPLLAGSGYWAYFASPATVSLPLSTTQPAPIQLPAGHFVTIGNPSTVAINVAGADSVFTYDATRGYQPTTILEPGQGAWAFSNNGSTLTMTPASVRTVTFGRT